MIFVATWAGWFARNDDFIDFIMRFSIKPSDEPIMASPVPPPVRTRSPRHSLEATPTQLRGMNLAQAPSEPPCTVMPVARMLELRSGGPLPGSDHSAPLRRDGRTTAPRGPACARHPWAGVEGRQQRDGALCDLAQTQTSAADHSAGAFRRVIAQQLADSSDNRAREKMPRRKRWHASNGVVF